MLLQRLFMVLEERMVLFWLPPKKVRQVKQTLAMMVISVLQVGTGDNIILNQHQNGPIAQDTRLLLVIGILFLSDPAFLEYRLNAYENSPGAISTEDWLFQTGITQNHDFSMSGGTEDVNYFASVGYQDTEGVVIYSRF